MADAPAIRRRPALRRRVALWWARLWSRDRVAVAAHARRPLLRFRGEPEPAPGLRLRVDDDVLTVPYDGLPRFAAWLDAQSPYEAVGVRLRDGSMFLIPAACVRRAQRLVREAAGAWQRGATF